MSSTKYTANAVKVLDGPRLLQPGGSVGHVPARSQLYGPPPCEVGTVWVESLSSYLQRLAARYCVAPRVFITEAIVPHLANWYANRPSFTTNQGSFYRREALAMNGAGDLAQGVGKTLAHLTGRLDIEETTLCSWASSLPSRALLRWSPGWCPACYTAWQEMGHPFYHPLLWMLQVVTICVHHRCVLIDHCPQCRQRQSVIATKTQPGYCTQCAHWLGQDAHSISTEHITDEHCHQQKWVVRCIEELYLGSRAFGALPWANLPQGLLKCREAMGDGRSLARFTNLPYSMLWPWSHGKHAPSFKRLLEFGYALDVTPMDLLVGTTEVIREQITTRERAWQSRSPRPATRSPIDWERISHCLQEVLAGREDASGVCSVARRVGISAKYLRKRFPKECAAITAQYQRERAKQSEDRIVRQCLEVRQVTMTLYEQGVKPSKPRVQALLSDAHILRKPECRATWHAVRRELGLEQ